MKAVDTVRGSSGQRRYTMHLRQCLHQLSKSKSGAAVCTEKCNSCKYIWVQYSCYSRAQRLQRSDVDTHTDTKCALLLDDCCNCCVCADLDTLCHSSTIVVSPKFIFTSSCCCKVWATKAVDTKKAVAVSADTQGMWENAFTSWTSWTVELLYERKHAIVATIWL
jgi:hypothetical protein